MKNTIPLTLFFTIFLLSGCSKEIQLDEGLTFVKTPRSVLELDWNSSGEKLALTTTKPVILGQPSTDIYVWQPPDGELIKATEYQHQEFTEHPVWSPIIPDELAFSSKSEFEEGQTGVVNLDSLEKRTISTSYGFIDWFSSGNELVQERYSSIQIITMDGEKIGSIGNWSKEKVSDEISLNPDETELAVALIDRVAYDNDSIVVIDISENTTKEIASNLDALRSVDWSPYGNWIAYVSGRQAYAIRPDGTCQTKPLELDGSLYDISWSPSGEQVAIAGFNGKNQGVYFLDTNSDFYQEWLASSGCK